MCEARDEVLNGLKPFVACCDLIVVIGLYTSARERVMTMDRSGVEEYAERTRVGFINEDVIGKNGGEACAE